MNQIIGSVVDNKALRVERHHHYIASTANIWASVRPWPALFNRFFSIGTHLCQIRSHSPQGVSMLWHPWEWDEQATQERSVSSLWQQHLPAHPLPYKSSVNWIDYEGSFITYDGNRGMCNLPSKEPSPLVFQHYIKPLIKQLLNLSGVVPACCPVCCKLSQADVWPWGVL